MRKLFALCVIIYGVTLICIVLFAALQPLIEPSQPVKTDRIIVLGAGMDADGTLHTSTILRVKKGSMLFHQGAAPKIHFTGGVGLPNGPSAGDQMAALARTLEVPASVITTETHSQSTLQNALFSRAAFDDTSHITLVTEGFHLPRAWASFKLFGAPKITLSHSTSFRTSGTNPFWSATKLCLREALAVWFNAARFLVWSALSLSNIDKTTRNATLT